MNVQEVKPKRSTRFLYQILIKEFSDCYFPWEGICNCLINMKRKDMYTSEEYDRITKHFRENKPTPELHPHFYYSNVPTFHYFPLNKPGHDTRIRFLRYLSNIC